MRNILIGLILLCACGSEPKIIGVDCAAEFTNKLTGQSIIVGPGFSSRVVDKSESQLVIRDNNGMLQTWGSYSQINTCE